MTVMTRDDLLGRPTGPMIPPDEAAATGRVSLTLVPHGTFVTYRRNPAKFGELTAEPNAYNTGRVRVLTPDHAERDFPAEGGTEFDAQREKKMSYRTRGEAYKFVPYGDANPAVGKQMWPAKQLFPKTPSMKKVDSIEHDIVPTSSRTSRRDSLVAPVDGDDSERGFDVAKEMKGDLAMSNVAEDEALAYGRSSGGARNVDSEDIMTMVAWDSQQDDWQLGAGKIRRGLTDLAAKVAHKIASAAVALAKKGGFNSLSGAVSWIRSRAEQIKVKKIKKAEQVMSIAVEEAIKIASPQIEKALSKGKGVADYLSNDESDALGAFRWTGKGYAWKGLGAFYWDPRSESFRWSSLSGDGEEYPEYMDGQDTTGWTGADNDGFPYLGGMGDIPGMVVSLDDDPAAAKAVTNAATAAVTSQVKSGEVSTTDQILKTISDAAKIAATAYTAQIAAKAGVPAPAAKPSIPSQIATTVLAPDQPLWKRPLFWIGAALLVGGVGFVALKGGSGGGTRRRSRRNFPTGYNRNFPTGYNRNRRWKSRWA